MARAVDFYQTMFFDLDETLYPKNNGVWRAISEKIDLFMVDRLQISEDEAQSLRQQYSRTFGTTLQGLRTFHTIDAEEYLDYVHDIPIEELIFPSPELRLILQAIKFKKIIFTNASRAHAERVLMCLDVSDLFDRIIDIQSLNYVNKPLPQAYQNALERSGYPNPFRCMIVDDQIRNLIPAKALGMRTILIGDSRSQFVDHNITTIEELSEQIFSPA